MISWLKRNVDLPRIVYHSQWLFVLYVMNQWEKPPGFLLMVFTWICGAAALYQFYLRLTSKAESNKNKMRGLQTFVTNKYAEQSDRHRKRIEEYTNDTLSEEAKKQLRTVLQANRDKMMHKLNDLTFEAPSNPHTYPRTLWVYSLRVLVALFGAPEALAPTVRLRGQTGTYQAKTPVECRVCGDEIVEGQTVVTLKPCDHVLHEPCWNLWGLHAAVCPVCGQVDEATHTWRDTLLAGDIQGAAKGCVKNVQPYYWKFLKMARSKRWRWVLRVYYATTCVRMTCSSELGTSYSVCMAFLMYRYYGKWQAFRVVMYHVGIAVANLLSLLPLWSPWCQEAEPELYKTFMDLKVEVEAEVKREQEESNARRMEAMGDPGGAGGNDD